MAAPDYFQRGAVAIAQTISGLDEQRLERILSDVCVGVTIDSSSLGREGSAIIDLLIRLLARLYPTMSIRDISEGSIESEATNLAVRVNPNIDFSETATIELVVGSTSKSTSASRTIFVGSDGWAAKLSETNPQTCGNSNNPFGAGLAACLAAATVFRHIFLHSDSLNCELNVEIPIASDTDYEELEEDADIDRIVLAGAGAIGNAAMWALSRTHLHGLIEIVDHEAIDLGNLQRYVLAERADENKVKAKLLAEKCCGHMKAEPYACGLSEFLDQEGHRTDTLMLALDSANDRRVAQASLPFRIINAWTQPDDLGVSVHSFTNGGCVNCLYMPEDKHLNEDEIIARSFGIPDKLMDVRVLLHRNDGAPINLLQAISDANNIALEKLLPFEGRTLRDLYVEGFCGGAVIPLDEIGRPTDDVHVPLAHQSALAGILLAAATIGVITQGNPEQSTIAQFDILKEQNRFHIYPVAKDSQGRCICQDKDYIEVFKEKYSLE